MPTRKILLKQTQSPGDILTASRGVYDFCRAYPEWQIDIQSPCSELFENNPYTTALKEGDEGVEVFNITYDDIQKSGWHGLHFAEAFRNDIERKVGDIEIPSTGLNPELYFTDEELSWINQVHCSFYWDGPFWLINAGRKSDNELKQYHRWQEVVDILNEVWQGRVRIVQIGSKSGGGMSHIHPPLRGAFNLTGRTTTRELLRLAYWSTGIIGPISFQFVIGASEFKNVKGETLQANKPNVVVAGGKEGHRWHVYNGVKWIDKNGCLQCAIADGCWLGGEKGQCKNLVKPDDKDEVVPLCFEITSPEEIAQAMLDHYNGGRLEMPEQELWHVPEGENRQPLIEKFGKAYEEGVFVE